MTKTEKEASAKKGARTRKRNEALAIKDKEALARKRKRTMNAKPTGLSDIFSPAAAQGAVKNGFMGAGGGIGAVFAEELFTKDFNMKPNRASWATIIGGLAVSALGNPTVGAGAIGYRAGTLLKRYMAKDKTVMNDNSKTLYLQDNKYVNNLEALPAVLDAEGQTMSEDYQVSYAPNFGGLNQ